MLGANGRTENDSIHKGGERVLYARCLQSLWRVLDIVSEMRTHCRSHDIHHFVRCEIDENVSVTSQIDIIDNRTRTPYTHTHTHMRV